MSSMSGASREQWFRRALAGIVSIVVIAFVGIGLVRVRQQVEENIASAVDGVVQRALVEIGEVLEEREADLSATVDEALEEAIGRFEEALQEALSDYPGPAEGVGARSRGTPTNESLRPPALSRSEAILLVKFNISMMTRRYSADAIENGQTLRDLDIDTQTKVEYFKGRLAASVRANLGGALDETRFQNGLQLSTGSTVAVVGSGLQRAYRVAWSSE